METPSLTYKTYGFTEEEKYFKVAQQLRKTWLVSSEYVSINRFVYTEITNILQNEYIFCTHIHLYMESNLNTFSSINRKLRSFQFCGKERSVLFTIV